ncbi:MAG: hypothetical protein V9G19_16300 [Tetrasphaera sp.]
MTDGVTFALTGAKRSSVAAAKTILARSVEVDDPALAQRIPGVGDWRHDYAAAFTEITRLEASSPEAAVRIAERGLAAVAEVMCFATDDGDQPLAHALAVDAPVFETVEVQGSTPREDELIVNYRGRALRGDALLAQLDDFVARGITEPSFAEAVGAVVRNPGWLDLRGRTFAVIGAGSAMGPFPQLMKWGATVAAVDLPRPATWYRLASVAAGGAGRLLGPARAGAGSGIETCGANLLTEVGPIARWLATAPGPLTLGNYSYADGALFVRLSVAVDLVIEHIRRARDDVSLAYLASPADVFTVPVDAVVEARRRFATPRPVNIAARGIHAATKGRIARPNYSDASIITTATGQYGLLDAIITEQGPNYVLAKRLQRWRMEETRAHGLLTSVHVAPPTRTASVTNNPAMAARQLATAHLGIETFDSEATEALAGAVLVHDLNNPDSPANPSSILNHPLESFHFAANPGGRWRIALDVSSSLPAVDSLSSAAGTGRNAVNWVRGRARRR